MDKNKFLKSFGEFDEFLIASLYEDISLCEDIDFPVYTKYFMPPRLSYKLENMKISNISFKLCGLTDNSEKNIIGIYPEGMEDYIDFPVTYFKITNKSKFRDLAHKDYLGSIMGMGIKRELLGDLIVSGKHCYGITSNENFNNFLINLETVGKNPVTVEEVKRNEIPKINFEEIIISLPSLRLDSIVSELAKTSRNKAISLIDSQFISLNYKIENNKSKAVEAQDIISIRKKGKFKIKEILGESKKGKIRILINKFN